MAHYLDMLTSSEKDAYILRCYLDEGFSWIQTSEKHGRNWSKEKESYEAEEKCIKLITNDGYTVRCGDSYLDLLFSLYENIIETNKEYLRYFPLKVAIMRCFKEIKGRISFVPVYHQEYYEKILEDIDFFSPTPEIAFNKATPEHLAIGCVKGGLMDILCVSPKLYIKYSS